MTAQVAYWDTFYRSLSTGSLGRPSSFAKWCVRQLWREPRGVVIDAGCGTGRDSVLWALAGWRVIAIDTSAEALKIAANAPAAFDGRIEVRLGDFTTMGELYAKAWLVYARWALHAIDAEGHARWLQSLRRLPAGAIVAIEARAIDGRGEHVEKRGGHYRRYLDPPRLVRELTGAGFELLKVRVGRGLSRMGEDDPLLVRIIAQRTSRPIHDGSAALAPPDLPTLAAAEQAIQHYGRPEHPSQDRDKA